MARARVMWYPERCRRLSRGAVTPVSSKYSPELRHIHHSVAWPRRAFLLACDQRSRPDADFDKVCARWARDRKRPDPHLPARSSRVPYVLRTKSMVSFCQQKNTSRNRYKERRPCETSAGTRSGNPRIDTGSYDIALSLSAVLGVFLWLEYPYEDQINKTGYRWR